MLSLGGYDQHYEQSSSPQEVYVGQYTQELLGSGLGRRE